MIHTDEDDEFARIEHEIEMKKGQPYHFKKRMDDDDIQDYVRPWVVLTDKEIEAIWKVALFADYGVGAELSNQPFVHYARAIEAKLKEKNNG
jgi:hypothetical protein